LELIDCREGVKLCLDVINYATAKDRKVILKNIKSNIWDIIMSNNSNSYLIILKLIHCVDDTILIDKFILKDMKQKMDKFL